MIMIPTPRNSLEVVRLKTPQSRLLRILKVILMTSCASSSHVTGPLLQLVRLVQPQSFTSGMLSLENIKGTSSFLRDQEVLMLSLGVKMETTSPASTCTMTIESTASRLLT